MNDGLKIVLAFSIGSAVGFIFSRSYFKTKYEKIADEEIESMRQHFKNKMEPQKETIKVLDDFFKEISPSVFPEKDLDENPSDVKEEHISAPYVISPEEYYDSDNTNERITLDYYAEDRILADDDHAMLEDVEAAVGHGWENRFGEFVNGAVYVRNESRGCDYEILYVPDSFTSEPIE